MITGDLELPRADVPASRDTWGSRALAVLLLAGCGLLVWWLIGLAG
jgi:hypothetical protein